MQQSSYVSFLDFEKKYSNIIFLCHWCCCVRGDQLPSVRNRKVNGSQKTDQSEMLALTDIFLRTGSHFADSRQWHSCVYRIACGEVGIKETVAQRKTSKSVHSSPLFFPIAPATIKWAGLAHSRLHLDLWLAFLLTFVDDVNPLALT